MKIKMCFLGSLLLLIIAVSIIKNTDYSSFILGTGGVLPASESRIAYETEITGNLTEDSRHSYDIEQIVTAASVMGGDADKFYRWGIFRNGENQLPNADPGAPELISKYGGIYLGDVAKKEIFLTFDQGYENGYTPKILDVLKENKARAVFFITGHYLKENSDLVKRMIDEGHIIGNHTKNHPSLPEISDSQIREEIDGLDKELYDKFKVHMTLLRPPKGEYSERMLALTQKMGYKNVFWSFAYDDWYKDKVKGGDYAYNIVMRNLHNGAIILLHAVSKDNADALDGIIKGAKQKGYEIGDVATLCR